MRVLSELELNIVSGGTSSPKGSTGSGGGSFTLPGGGGRICPV